MVHSDTAVGYVTEPGRVAELGRSIRLGELTATALVEICLERIRQNDPVVEAWCCVMSDRALAEAAHRDREAQAGRFRGALHGIPVGIKDVIDVQGVQTVGNSKSRAGIAPASADAEAVAALRAAGAVILGKTQTAEFAYFDPPPTHNPHNVEHTPGGSSSGSAAAVAAGMVPLALGTQTGASVNRPAAYCGVAAFKPSTQLTCMHGVVPLAPSFDTIGYFGRDVADAVALFQAICPAFARGRTKPGERRELSLVLLDDPILDDCNPEILGGLRQAADRLTGAGHRVQKAASPERFATLFHHQVIITRYEGARIHGGLLRAPEGMVGPKMLEMIEFGRSLTQETYLETRQAVMASRTRFWSAFDGVDAFLFPATPHTAPPGIASTGDPTFISPWTVLGGPIVTHPLGYDLSGLPLGCLLCGAPGHDLELGEVAQTIAESLHTMPN